MRKCGGGMGGGVGRRCGRSINMLKALIMFVCSQKFTMQTPSPSLAGFTHLLTIGVAFLW